MVAGHPCPDQRTVDKCEIWQTHRTQYRDPLIQTTVLDWPWQKVGMWTIFQHWGSRAQGHISWGYHSSCEGGFRSSWITRDCRIWQRVLVRDIQNFCTREQLHTHHKQSLLPTSKWLGWMCCSDCQESMEKRQWPNQSTTGIQSPTALEYRFSPAQLLIRRNLRT